MKKLKKNLNKLIVLLMLLTVNINVFAQVLTGYKQVNNKGGENTSSDGVTVSKTIEETDIENYFDITLKVTTTSKLDEILRDPDLAVVIVMDVSNTMVGFKTNGKENNYGTKYTYNANDGTRFSAALSAGSKFISSFAEYSSNVSSDTLRKIGYVAFNTNGNKIFDLTDCKNTTTANSLINTMENATKNIVEQQNYYNNNVRYTNMEAGLKMAKDMLDGVTADNKYIIFLTDGLPTTYLNNNSNYTGYAPVTTSATSSGTGVFYNNVREKNCPYGVNYSNLAATRARNMASSVKNSGITVYSVGVGIDKQITVPEMHQTEQNESKYSSYSLIDLNVAMDDIETGKSTADFKNWLKNTIGSNEYYDSTDKTSLENAYANIFAKIKNSIASSIEASWVVEDPMSASTQVSNIEFIGIYDDRDNKKYLYDEIKKDSTEYQSDAAKFNSNSSTINWDLKNSSYETKTSGNKTYYEYEMKYRVRLENELSSFKESTVYDTNGPTTLNYVVRTNGVLSDLKTIDFPIPSVEGYLGNLTFTKLSNYYQTPLTGATFILIHDDDNCPCHNERKHVGTLTYTSQTDSLGKVTFTNIPSGHTYKLKETVAPTNYKLSTKEYTVVVSYGETTLDGKRENLTIENEIKTSNLKVKKTVQGNTESSGEFDFEILLKNGNNPITGTFNYQIGTKESTITFDENGKSEFKLKHNEEIIIFNLPYDVTYKITEKNTFGYQVKYCINETNTCINSESIQIGKEVNGNINENNNIEFVNITGYVLPETGSSMGLIMMIIASITLIAPIIYITYSFIDERKERRI